MTHGGGIVDNGLRSAVPLIATRRMRSWTVAVATLIGTVTAETATGWVVGGTSHGHTTQSNGDAWGTDGRAVILSYQADDETSSPRLDLLPIVGQDVITGVKHCLGPRDLPSRASASVAVDTVSEPGATVQGEPVSLTEFVRALGE